MTKASALTHEFVEFIPDKLEEGKLYVSIEYATVVHKCCCGCGAEVVTPLSSTDWKLIFDGETVSLDPSIGNWSVPCRSHYWIRNNRVKWSTQWSKAQIERGRKQDLFAKETYYGGREDPADAVSEVQATAPQTEKPMRGFWRSLKWWS
jgi:hypothetical protein